MCGVYLFSFVCFLLICFFIDFRTQKSLKKTIESQSETLPLLRSDLSGVLSCLPWRSTCILHGEKTGNESSITSGKADYGMHNGCSEILYPAPTPPAMLENCVSPENRHGHNICFGQESMSRNDMCHLMIKEFNSLDYLSTSAFSDCGDYWILYWYNMNGGSNTKTLVLTCIIADLENRLHSKWMTYVQTTLSLRHWYFGVDYYHSIIYLNWCAKLT